VALAENNLSRPYRAWRSDTPHDIVNCP